MENIIDELEVPEVEYYGAHRILGRAYFKIPKLLGGSMRKSLRYLKTACELTMHPTAGISKYATNVTYYRGNFNEGKKEGLGQRYPKQAYLVC